MDKDHNPFTCNQCSEARVSEVQALQWVYEELNFPGKDSYGPVRLEEDKKK